MISTVVCYLTYHEKQANRSHAGISSQQIQSLLGEAHCHSRSKQNKAQEANNLQGSETPMGPLNGNNCSKKRQEGNQSSTQ